MNRMGSGLSKLRRSSSWSDLPPEPELVGLILCRLLSYTDRLRFRAVCRQWRLATQQAEYSLPPALPWIRLKDFTFPFHSPFGGELRRFWLRSMDGWLEHYSVTGTTTLLANPFTGATVYVPPSPLVDKPIIKMVVSSSPEIIAAILDYSRKAVGFYRAGSSSWHLCSAPHDDDDDDDAWDWYEDIAFHHGKLYALTDREELFSHELVVDGSDNDTGYRFKVSSTASHSTMDHVIKEQQPPATNRSCWSPRYLVASCGKLLMVKWSGPSSDPALCTSINNRTDKHNWWHAVKLKVLEADLEMGRWLELKNGCLDGHALFISPKSSRAVRLSSNDHECQQDHVYFRGVDLRWMDNAFRSFLCVSYDLRNDRISQIVRNKGDTKDMDIQASGWFFPRERYLERPSANCS